VRYKGVRQVRDKATQYMPGVCQKPFAFSRLPPESQQAKSGDGRRKLTRCSSFVITMCSVLKRASSRYWCAAFRDDAGRQLRRSTKETDRRKALRIAEVFEQMARKKPNAAPSKRRLTSFTGIFTVTLCLARRCGSTRLAGLRAKNLR
jgi:hypothetical protein